MTHTSKHEDSSLILVVEDDHDSLDFLVDELSEEYETLSAANGREGLEMAMESIPDLIVTDLMMPVMDGLEMCARIKRSPETSHIPIIMLTAKASVESQLEGLHTGADDYVTKPFVLELLQARISNLLETRRMLHDRYSRELPHAEKMVFGNSPDQEFLNKTMHVLEECVSDPEFDAEHLASKLALSLSTLHRKLKALIGETPAKMIWNARLKIAARLLKTTEFRVTEIAHMVGYTDSNHFGRQFKQTYGVTPSQFRSNSE